MSIGTVIRRWLRIGLIGLGGPPTHIALIRELVVRERWMSELEVEDAIAACNLLPGPASTQLAIFCAQRVGGRLGAVAGGLAFIAPGLGAVIALSVLFLSSSPPNWIRGAGAGAGAAVAAVAVRASVSLIAPSLERSAPAGLTRWFAYLVLGGLAAAIAGPLVVGVLVGCGVVELVARSRTVLPSLAVVVPAVSAPGGLGALCLTAIKVGALSFGGGFVIVPLMQGDAVHSYHWMTSSQFLNAVAIGQVTPGPVVATVAAVGYAARGIGGALLAAAVAFAPSFGFVLLGAGRFRALRSNPRAQAFLAGAGPAAIGAIMGTAIPLAAALGEWWQFVVLAVASVALLVIRAGIVQTLLLAGAVGALAALAGAPLP